MRTLEDLKSKEFQDDMTELKELLETLSKQEKTGGLVKTLTN